MILEKASRRVLDVPLEDDEEEDEELESTNH